MCEQQIKQIENKLVNHLTEFQMKRLHETLTFVLQKSKDLNQNTIGTNIQLLNNFLNAKRVEGCSLKTVKYYRMICEQFIRKIGVDIKDIDTDTIRQYISNYQNNHNISKTSIDNIRRVLSSLFSWLEEENYIQKNPMKRIHKIREEKIMKEAFSNEILAKIKDGCTNIRDLAIINLLSSTGMRVGELVLLNKDDIDFINKECVVFGKGSKERRVYFDSETKIQLIKYINSRTDNEKALFVSRLKPYKRLQISGVEIMLRELGKLLSIKNVHPHRFRRTLATDALNKGMPIEQLQLLLGHTKIDTTLRYAVVDQNNVKYSYKKIFG